MIVEFHNRIAKKKADLICDIIKFASDKLFPHENVHINIETIKLDYVKGDCMDEEDNEFTIRLDKRLSNNDMTVTLFHELIHVSQYLKGLKFDTQSDYLSRWQEVEAYTMESVLYEQYLKTA